MQMFTLEQLSDTFPNYLGDMKSEFVIDKVETDSSKEMHNALFVPIIGDNFDGHSFISGAIQQGAVATLWDQKVPVPSELQSSLVFFLVEDTVHALQQLAKRY